MGKRNEEKGRKWKTGKVKNEMGVKKEGKGEKVKRDM